MATNPEYLEERWGLGGGFFQEVASATAPGDNWFLNITIPTGFQRLFVHFLNFRNLGPTNAVLAFRMSTPVLGFSGATTKWDVASMKTALAIERETPGAITDHRMQLHRNFTGYEWTRADSTAGFDGMITVVPGSASRWPRAWHQNVNIIDNDDPIYSWGSGHIQALETIDRIRFEATAGATHNISGTVVVIGIPE